MWFMVCIELIGGGGGELLCFEANSQFVEFYSLVE